MRIAVIGEEGSGKSLAMSALGALLSEIYNIPLAANYPMYGVQKFQFIDTMDKLKNFKNGVLLLDEVWLLMDSRNPRDNVEFSRWVRQTRKKHLLIFYATQSLDQVDKRMRHSTSLVMLCEKRREAIMMYMCDMASGRIRKTFKIADPSQFYGLYDTNGVVDLLQDS